jgi:alkyl hydroperoxide reductase subunit D
MSDVDLPTSSPQDHPMTVLDTFTASFPDSAKDIRLNLAAVLQPGTLSPAQRWGVALASAHAARNGEVVAALRAAAEVELLDGIDTVLADAQAAAAVMAMNNVYYRFRHFMGGAYDAKPPRLRMNRLAQPATDKATFELMCLAVSALNGCELCVRSHDQAVKHAGLGDDHVHEAVRIAAVVHAAAVVGESTATAVARTP